MVMVRLLSACAPSKAPGPKESLRHRHQQPWPGWFMVCRTQGGSELRGKATRNWPCGSPWEEEKLVTPGRRPGGKPDGMEEEGSAPADPGLEAWERDLDRRMQRWLGSGVKGKAGPR